MLAPDELANGARPEKKRAISTWFVAALAALLALASIAVAIAARDHHHVSQRLKVVQQLKPAAPSVATGSTDLIVESSSFTSEGSRAPLPANMVTVVSAVPGVGSVRGVVRGFARVGSTTGSPMASSPWNGRLLPTVVVSWDGGYFQLTAGRGPAGTGEVAVDAQVGQMLGIKVGAVIQAEGSGPPLSVVGIFSLRATPDFPRVSLLAAPVDDAQRLTGTAGFTRLDVTVAKGQDVEVVREAVASRLAAGFSVVGVSRLGTLEELQDELLIQRAYFDLLSPDGAIRTAAVQGGQDNAANEALYQRYAQAASEATLWIQRFTFTDADHAQIVYAVYWMSGRSPIIADPQPGAAVRVGGLWKIATATWCNLANVIGQPCTTQDGVPPPTPSPPAGWDAPSTQAGAVAAFRTIADPTATLAQRVAAVVDGDAQRQVIAAGLNRDALHAGHVNFSISGVRSRGAGQVDVLYSLTVSDASGLDTPYPLIGQAVLIQGGWKASGSYACGLAALAGQSCGPVAP